MPRADLGSPQAIDNKCDLRWTRRGVTVRVMNLGDLLQRYFATTDLSDRTPRAVAAGLERIHVDFGLERDSAKRFALWCLLYMFDDAPALDVAFEDETERDAARNFMDLMAMRDDGE